MYLSAKLMSAEMILLVITFRADEWDVNKWVWDGILKVISKGEDCIIRLEEKNTGENTLVTIR